MSLASAGTGAACPICNRRNVAVRSLPWPRFRHADFSIFAPAPIDLTICGDCGATRVQSEGEDLSAHFRDPAYVFRDVPIHTVRLPSSGKVLPAPDYQASLLVGALPERPSILDVGCFDGRLLRAFARIRPEAELVGFDVSPRGAELVQRDGENLTYVSGRLLDHGFRSRFDLITLSHSIQYEDDLNGLMRTLHQALKPEGRLFVQVSDIEQKPSGLLLADLHHHFTRASLQNLFALNGFVPEFCEAEGFPRDILMVGRPADRLAPTMMPNGARAMDNAIDRLSRQAELIRSKAEQGRWHVLGTTIDAAFAAWVLADKAAGFVDENCDGEGTFHGKPVRHPRTLSDGDLTLLPFGPAAGALLTRFQTTYRGSFELV